MKLLAVLDVNVCIVVRRAAACTYQGTLSIAFLSQVTHPRLMTQLETTVEKSVEAGIDESLSFQRNKRLSTSEFYAI